jgi:peptidoglycan hydrolase-like protein with peptidoglycan-binding domain
METFAYIHLALANEAPADSDYTASISTNDSPNLFERLNQQKLSTSAALPLLSLTVALGVLGMARQASALVKVGDQGAEVTALQERLQALGYFKSNATGYFGSVTKDAVIRFQQAKGLTPDGVVGTDTEESLREKSLQSQELESESSKRILQLGDRGSQVNAIQKRLAVAGFSSGENGIFDEATQDAVERFQQRKGLMVDGIVGEQTLAALPALGESNQTTAPKKELNQTTAPKKPTNWFENKEAPLVPFTRLPEESKGQ